MENNLFNLVQQAQAGDKDAMEEIILMFMPIIRSIKHKLKPDRQDDIEQNIVETLIKKIKSYDLSHAPDFTSFCSQLADPEQRSRTQIEQSPTILSESGT